MRTFLDTGILITAWYATKRDSAAALSIITDESRQLLTSDMVKLEVLPKPLFFKQKKEVAFYEEIFARAESLPVTELLFLKTFELAKTHGLSAGDAFNLAAAIALGADEFVTTETSGKPMFRVRQVRVVSLHAAAAK